MTRKFLLTAGGLWLATQAGAALAQPQTKPALPKLKTKAFDDGTGSIGLAPDWVLDGAYRGSCGCKGPNGAGIIMGFGTAILRPDHPMARMPETPANIPRATAGDLGGAIRSILEKGGSRVKSLRSRRAMPASPGVPALYFLYEYQKQDGKMITSLGYFTSFGTYEGSPNWQLYSSYVAAPSERFMKDLPTMMAMYNSWRPNGNKPKDGTTSAQLDADIAESQKRMGESMKARRESFERMQAKFREVL